MANTSQTRTIKILVDTKGSKDLNDIAKALGGVGKNVSSLAELGKRLSNVFSGLAAYFGVKQLIAFSDEMQNLNNRLVVLSGSQEKADATLKKLLQTANETQTSVDSLAEIYARLSSSLTEAHASSDSLVALTKVLQNTFRLSGSTIEETTATVIQLSQAFSSGQLRGQELRSVLEQNALLASLLRKEFGKDIFKKAEQGMISAADVVKLLTKNFDDINAKAELLTPTIGQSVTRAFNGLKVAINDVNKELGVASGFSKGVDIFIEKASLIAVVLGALALTQIPALITAIKSLSAVVLAFIAENPILAALSLISIAIVFLVKNLDELIAKMKRVGAAIIDLEVYFLSLKFTIEKSLYDVAPFDALGDNIQDIGLHILDLKEKSKELKASPLLPDIKTDGAEKAKEELLKLQHTLEALYKNNKEKKIKEILGELNQSFLDGKVTLGEYNEKLLQFDLYKATRQFKEGKLDINGYNDALEKVNRIQINRQFNQGELSLREFNQAISESDIGTLKDKLDAGKISLDKFNIELVKIQEKFSAGSAFRAGTQEYIESIGTVSAQVADAIRDVFKGLEDGLVDFIKTGKFNFDKFTQDILDDLTRIIIRASIVKPLAEGLLGGLNFSGGGSGKTLPADNFSGVQAAKGYAFDRGIKKFATGGVVGSPTLFGYGSGKTGLMGEAGPEAILPLARGKGGNLGVQATVTPVTINLINQTSSDVQASEKTGPNGERTIELLITDKVRQGLGSGQFDKVLASSFNIRRKGS